MGHIREDCETSFADGSRIVLQEAAFSGQEQGYIVIQAGNYTL